MPNRLTFGITETVALALQSPKTPLPKNRKEAILVVKLASSNPVLSSLHAAIANSRDKFTMVRTLASISSLYQTVDKRLDWE